MLESIKNAVFCDEFIQKMDERKEKRGARKEKAQKEEKERSLKIFKWPFGHEEELEEGFKMFQDKEGNERFSCKIINRKSVKLMDAKFEVFGKYNGKNLLKRDLTSQPLYIQDENGNFFKVEKVVRVYDVPGDTETANVMLVTSHEYFAEEFPIEQNF